MSGWIAGLTADDCAPWMREAIAQAREAAAAGEVPVGAVVVCDGQIIGRGHDRKIELSDPTAHAEILALREAAGAVGDWRLESCALIVTLEPCPMCAGAALLARIPLVVFGARNAKFGAVETHLPLLKHSGWNHAVRTIEGVLAEECADVLTRFFESRRNEGASST
ncbi:MAG: tRNA adenosine(34) deaminase TadA [Candidatus Sumerlaeaceae bacterium]|nr:tRNA adenosine(34) deaminase TadA [Candidatus Sumerlaeaceae bacterium]